MHIKDIKNKLKVLKKRAQGSVGTAIKVLTATVLGASILVGGYALTSEVVLPSTTEKVESMFAYSADADANAGGTGTVEPTPEGPSENEILSFSVYAYNDNGVIAEIITYNYIEGMTWAEWCISEYCPTSPYYPNYKMFVHYTQEVLDETGLSYRPDEIIAEVSFAPNIGYSTSSASVGETYNVESWGIFGTDTIDPNIVYLVHEDFDGRNY